MPKPRKRKQADDLEVLAEAKAPLPPKIGVLAVEKYFQGEMWSVEGQGYNFGGIDVLHGDAVGLYIAGGNAEDVAWSGPFSHGLPHGIFHFWNREGVPNRKVSFSRGLREGPDSLYRPDGSIESTRVFHQGNLLADVLVVDQGGVAVETVLFRN